MPSLPSPPLLLITDRTQAAGGLRTAVAAAIQAGCRWVSLRERDLPLAAQADLLRALRPLIDAVGGVLTVHASLELTPLCHGVHLPDGADIVTARRTLGPNVLIGSSTHDRAGVHAAHEGGADYATLSPIFPTMSKPGYGPALGPDMLTGLPLPILALGGVDAGNAHLCLRSGAAGLAVMGTIMRDPTRVTGLLAALAATPGRKTGI